MHKNGHRVIFIISCLLSAAAIGCSIDPVEQTGRRCPPVGETGNLSYIYLGGGDAFCTESAICHETSFEFNTCPLEINKCNVDSNGKFYCSLPCSDANMITCEGKCIDPNTSEEFCGAIDDCNGYNCCRDYQICNQWQECYKDPTSNQARCRNKTCTDNETRCINRIDENGKEKSVTERCQNGAWTVHENCAYGTTCNAEQTACETSVNCIYKDKTINNGTSICDNDSGIGRIVSCENATIKTVECKIDETTGMQGLCTNHENGISCTIPQPNDCLLSSTVVPHNTSICENNNIRSCFNGVLDRSSCPPMHDLELTVCNKGECVKPVNCPNGFKHQDLSCQGNQIVQCYNGEFVNYEEDENKGDCSKNTDGKTACEAGQCVIPKLNTIQQLHQNYHTLINLDTCKDSSDREYYDSARPVELTVEGVVTAIREDELGFVIQEPSEDGKQAGIYVYCQGKDCMKYTGTDTHIQVGDNVKITSDGIGHYYCQMQIRSFQNKLIVEKTDKTETIAPVIVLANDINTGKPNSPYYGSLVTLERFTTGTDKQDKPTGWPGLDENGKDIIVNNGLKPETLNAMEPQKTYQVTGIVNWAFNKNVLVPRSNDDIVFQPNCEANETSVKCLKTAGTVYLTTCTDGQETQEACASNKQCDKDNQICRDLAICTDKDNANITENQTGCFKQDDKEYIGTCTYNNGPVWDAPNATLCDNGCNAAKTACKHEKLAYCQYTNLNKDTLQSAVRVNIPQGAEITTNIYCTTDLTKPILQWPFKADTQINTQCTDCAADTTEFITNNVSMPNTEGKHYCVAIASVKDENQYLCPPTGGELTTITNTSTTTASYAQTYNVTRPILAEWNFDDQNLDVDGGSVTAATFALVNAGGKSHKLEDTGKSGKAVSAQANWSTEATPKYDTDPHWEMKINTTGYKNIAISFSVRASGSNPKSFALAYKTDDVFSHVGTDLTFTEKDKFQDYPTTLLPNADNKPLVTIGIFPYATTSTPNVRIDDVKIFGDPI